MSGGRNRRSRLRPFVPAIILFVMVLALASVFNHVLLPFLVALFIVYLIEPVVARIARLKVRGKPIPRWGAVLAVYLSIFSGVTLVSAFFIPALGREVSSLATEMPRFFREIREERLPAWQERIEELVSNFSGSEMSDVPVEEAQETVSEAIEDAAVQAILYAGLTEEERVLYQDAGVPVQRYGVTRDRDTVLLRVSPTTQGELEVMLGPDELHIERTSDETFVVRMGEPEATGEGGMDLEAALNQQLAGLVETSGELAGELIEFAQHLIGEIIEAFITLIVTLMVAAFISIDAPGIMRFFRSLFPTESLNTVNEVVKALDKGLSGVIRGQLMICLVNGILTGIGLAILNVKFALILALIAGTLSLIPIFGTIISTIPAVAVGLTSSFMTGVLVLVWILVIHFVEANILNPKIIGTTAEIHPALIVFALLAGEHSFGLIGALLAVPTASILQTLFLYLRDYYKKTAQDPKEPETNGDPIQRSDGRRAEAEA